MRRRLRAAAAIDAHDARFACAAVFSLPHHAAALLRPRLPAPAPARPPRLCRAFAPSLPLAVVAVRPGFADGAPNADAGGWTAGTIECEKWLRQQGAVIILRTAGRNPDVDTKATAEAPASLPPPRRSRRRRWGHPCPECDAAIHNTPAAAGGLRHLGRLGRGRDRIGFRSQTGFTSTYIFSTRAVASAAPRRHPPLSATALSDSGAEHHRQQPPHQHDAAHLARLRRRSTPPPTSTSPASASRKSRGAKCIPPVFCWTPLPKKHVILDELRRPRHERRELEDRRARARRRRVGTHTPDAYV